MICTNCGSDRIEHSQRDFDCGPFDGLDIPVILVDTPVYRCTACGDEGFSLLRPAQLSRTIALSLATSSTQLTGKQVTFLRKFMKMTQAQLALQLGGKQVNHINRVETDSDCLGGAAELLLRLLCKAHIQGADFTIQTLPTASAASPLRLERDQHGDWQQVESPAPTS